MKRNLDSLGWTQADLAEILGRPLQVINEIIAGKKGITPETAKGLAQAFGGLADVWMNLDAMYQLSRSSDPDPGVAVRAKVFAKGPIKEMIRRGWLPAADDADALAKAVLAFYELDDMDQTPQFSSYAARKSTPYLDVMPSQAAWLFGAKRIAEKINIRSAFSEEGLTSAVKALTGLLAHQNDIRHVPQVLSEAGIRFLVMEALPQTRIDGACFWLNDDEPVVVVSFRYDRLDYFWHTLMHELGHVSARDGLDNDNNALDRDLVGAHTANPGERPSFEKQADLFAVETLVPQRSLDSFIDQSRPLYSRLKIVTFADRMGVHPGIVVGQLQYRGEIQYSHSRDLLVKVRDLLLETAATDGWGKTAKLN